MESDDAAPSTSGAAPPALSPAIRRAQIEAVTQQARQLQSALAALALDGARPDPAEPLLSADEASLLLDVQCQLGALVSASASEASAAAAAVGQPTSMMEEGSGDGVDSVDSNGNRLGSLDDVLLGQILVFLPATDLARARRVSRRLLLVASGRDVWRPLCRREWPWIDQLATEAGAAAAGDGPTAHHRLYRQRALARRLVRPSPEPPASAAARKPLSDLELCVDLWVDGAVWWSARGPLPVDEEAFQEALFSFQGFELKPTAVVEREDRPLIFGSLAEVLDWFNGNAIVRLDFTLRDTMTEKMADLSSVLRRTALSQQQQQQPPDAEGQEAAVPADLPLEGTRASIGWDSAGQGNVEEVWVFGSPDMVFLQGEIRLLRGLTLRAFGFQAKAGNEVINAVGVNVVSAWICDHQYLGGPKPSVEDVRAVIFEELKWV